MTRLQPRRYCPEPPKGRTHQITPRIPIDPAIDSKNRKAMHPAKDGSYIECCCRCAGCKIAKGKNNPTEKMQKQMHPGCHSAGPLNIPESPNRSIQQSDQWLKGMPSHSSANHETHDAWPFLRSSPHGFGWSFWLPFKNPLKTGTAKKRQNQYTPKPEPETILPHTPATAAATENQPSRLRSHAFDPTPETSTLSTAEAAAKDGRWENLPRHVDHFLEKKGRSILGVVGPSIHQVPSIWCDSDIVHREFHSAVTVLLPQNGQPSPFLAVRVGFQKCVHPPPKKKKETTTKKVPARS